MDETIAKEHWVLGFEIVEEFYEKYKEFFKNIIKKIQVPAFFKLMREMSHYYAFKNEYQAIFPDGNNLQVSTVQWDIKNGERFNIMFTDKNGKKIPVPYIIHASSFGSIERAMAAILETGAWMEKEGKAPMLPLWLSPEQVRLIPVSCEKHLKKCEEIAEKLEKEKIRVGVDDRDLTVPKKVFEAKRSWVPYIIVIGDKELKSKKFPVVMRERSSLKKEFRKNFSLKEFINGIEEKTSGMPFRPLYIPRELSRRVIFVPWGAKAI
jgi:threonyl-tRNA synthetase